MKHLVHAVVFVTVLISCAPDAVQTTSVQATTRTTDRPLDDETIRTRVKSAFLNAPGLQARQIEVEVKSRTVRLSGVVSNFDQERRAVDIARGVEGVKDVRSWIQVQ